MHDCSIKLESTSRSCLEIPSEFLQKFLKKLCNCCRNPFHDFSKNSLPAETRLDSGSGIFFLIFPETPLEISSEILQAIAPGVYRTVEEF